MTIENMEGAIAMLEAYISGGDELGIVPEDDACEALNFIRGAVGFMADVNEAQLATVQVSTENTEKSLEILRMYLDNVKIAEIAMKWAIVGLMHAETAANRACAKAVEYLAEEQHQTKALSRERDALLADNELLRDRLGKRLEAYDAVSAERDALRARLNHIDHEWTKGVHSSGWAGVPVTNEQPPDRSMEDADNDSFFGRR